MKLIYKIAEHFGVPSTEREDLIGDTCLAFLSTYGDRDFSEIPLPLFMTIYHSRFVDWTRKEKLYADILSIEESDPEELDLPDTGRSFLYPEEYADLLGAAECILSSLGGNRGERDAILCRIREESAEEACRELNITREAYRARLFRARKKLLRALEEYWEN